jgi:hypothetical protein
MNDLDRQETPDHPLAPGEATTIDENLPGDWKRLDFEFTGNFRLKATYSLPSGVGHSANAVVTISPYKSYDDAPGFPDCHTVQLRDYTARDPPAKTVLGESPSETEYVVDALDLALDLMIDFLDEDDADVAPVGEVVDARELAVGDFVRLDYWTEPLEVVATPDENVVELDGWRGCDKKLVRRADQTTLAIGNAPPRPIEYLRRVDPDD